VATAPTPVLMCGTTAPTAKKRVATAMPTRPVASSRATMDHVIDGFSAASRANFCQSSPDWAASSMRDLASPPTGPPPRSARPTVPVLLECGCCASFFLGAPTWGLCTYAEGLYLHFLFAPQHERARSAMMHSARRMRRGWPHLLPRLETCVMGAAVVAVL